MTFEEGFCAVVLGSLLSGLAAANTLTGSVTGSDGGGPVGEGRVELYSPSGSFAVLASADWNAAGSYQFEDLSDGDYIVFFRPRGSFDHYIAEIHDDVACPGRVCNFAALGSPISLSGGETLTVDAVLDPGATIMGTLTAEDTGQPLPGVSVTAISTNTQGNAPSASAQVLADGSYALNGLEDARSYYVFFISSNNGIADRYVGQAFANLPCVGLSCRKTDATAVLVSTSTPVVIDAALQRGAVILGAVSESSSGAPIRGVRIAAFREPEVFGARSSVTSSTTGDYRTRALPAGDYLVTFDPSAEYLAEVWEDFPCPNLACDFADSGTLLSLAVGDELTINASLDFTDGIFGTVTASDSGLPLRVQVRVYSDTGIFVTAGESDATDGDYRIGLPDGDYFLVFVANGEFEAYTDELYQGVPCPDFLCDITGRGTLVRKAGADVELNVELDRGLTISGTVTTADTDMPISMGEVEIYTADGQLVSTDRLSNLGAYSINVVPGTYYVVFETLTVGPQSSYQREVFDDVLCPSLSCDPVAQGTPVVVSADSVVIDAQLRRAELVFSDGFEAQ